MNAKTDLKWALPLAFNAKLLCIVDAGHRRVADIRGWGHLTGSGGLQLPPEQAEAIQHARGQALVDALNAALTPAAPRHAFTRRTVAMLSATVEEALKLHRERWGSACGRREACSFERDGSALLTLLNQSLDAEGAPAKPEPAPVPAVTP